jgi:hypothetical protein
VLITGGLVLGAIILAYFVHERMTRPDISGLAQACKDGDIEKIEEILRRNKNHEDLNNWILFGKWDVKPNEVIGEGSPMYLASLRSLDAIKLLMEKLDVRKFREKQKSGELNLLPLFDLIVDNSPYAKEIFKYFFMDREMHFSGDREIPWNCSEYYSKALDCEGLNDNIEKNVIRDLSVDKIKGCFEEAKCFYHKQLWLKLLFKSKEDLLPVDVKKDLYKKILFNHRFVNDPEFKDLVKFAKENNVKDKNDRSVEDAISKYGKHKN